MEKATSSLSRLRRAWHAKFIDWREKRQLAAARRAVLRAGKNENAEITSADWPDSLKNPTEFYGCCFRYFHFRLPEPVREHRRYFEMERRGFGEPAFHVMWFLLCREF